MVDKTVASQNQLDSRDLDQLSKKLSGKIDKFLVLCVYEQEHKKQDDKGMEIESWKGSLTALPLFKDVSGSNSFMIWERVYQESAHVFNSLRLIARNRLIRQIAEHIVLYILTKYKKFSPTIANIQNDKSLKDRSVQYFEEILKRDTFLVSDDVWQNFCDWFRIHLTEWVLNEMIQSIGSRRLIELDQKELNELFYQYISLNLSENKDFLTRFTNIVNTYTIDWVKKIITILNLDDCTVQQVDAMLNLKEETSFLEFPLTAPMYERTYHLAVHDCIYVMNNAPYQSVREVFYKMCFHPDESSLWPTASLVKGSVEGVLQIKPFKKDHYSFNKNHSIVKETWEEAQSLSDLGADVFDALCTFFLSKAKHHDDIVDIQLDDLLAIRGLKPKLGGEGRRGGYEEKQRRQILKSLSTIQKLWIDLNKTVIYEKGKPVKTSLQGRAFIFVDQKGSEYPITEESSQKKIRYKVDQVFAKYLFGSGRQVALLPLKGLHYDPYRKTWEKRLTRYLSWRWRIQARKGEFLQPNKISTLLDAIGVKINERTPSRTRERLEIGLDTLQQDGVIGSWYYEKWHEAIADQKGWGRIWINATIIIDPPEYIKEQYRSIRKSPPGKSIRQLPRDVFEEVDDRIGIRVRELREKFDLSLSLVSEELEISTSYLSNIERGIKIPSKKIKIRLMNWLDHFQ
ncbi:helix-turn-helix transcriptional regulator [Neobacillus niacini]|uniref:helix-turn-helix domain-containing protein n=1 Tax=Neobacillus niacini TaxID=86668 RepID=UPI0007AB8242|nr:helix-turn-helix transcriptional regulator [Neobacillus niacini]MEC1524585.1 helix-turn-helix transcriptional regulator [Neobacillus niacini]